TEVAARLKGAREGPPGSPAAVHPRRGGVRRSIATLESKHPGTMLNLMKSREKIAARCSGTLETEPVRHCKECGDPCSGEVCQLCKLKKSLNTGSRG
ncbi:MAG: hypothetical protein CW742_05260, partial [Methanoregula sp.]